MKKFSYYRFLMILVCLLNVAAYGMHDFKGRLDETKEDKNINKIAGDIEFGCEIAFIVEIFFELIARGLFLGKRAFFKNPWLVCNLISIICSMLRPLRIIQMITPLKIQFERLLRSIPKINTSIWRLIIFMAFFTIVGLHIFMGSLEYRCRVSDDPPVKHNEEWKIYEDIPFLCGQWQCPEDSYCRSPFEYDREYDVTETEIQSLNYGYTNFDHFGDGFFTVFHVMRLIGWGRITFMYWRQVSTVVVAVYFLSLVIMCSYVLSNIILAELYESFEEQRSIKSYAEYRMKKKMQKENKTKVNIKDIELEYQKQLNNEGIVEEGEIQIKKYSNFEELIIEEDLEEEIDKQENNVLSPKNLPNFQETYLAKQMHVGTEQMIQNDGQFLFASKATLSNKTPSIPDKQYQNTKQLINLNAIQVELAEKESNGFHKGEEQIQLKNQNKSPESKQNPSNSILPKSGFVGNQQAQAETNQSSEEKVKPQQQSLCQKINGFQGILSIIFRLSILLDIVVLCADRFEIDSYEQMVYIEIDWIILWIFICEILVKMIQQRLDYFKDILNDIDLVILVIRFISSNFPLFSGKNLTDEDEEWIHAVKAIHVFRIFQVVKITSFFRTVNILISNFFNTLVELLYYIIIILFYSALFALIGHELFAYNAEFINGDEIPKDLRTGKPPRINYDTFFSSFEAVFLAVLNEQWNESMYNYMRSIGDYVCSFWIIIISTGEIFILKLLMALFINTFLKHFNNRPKDKNDEIEEEQLNDIVRNQVMAGAAAHQEHHDHHHKEFFLKTFCRKLEHSEKFENFIMCVIIVNIIVMAVDSPLTDHHDPTKQAIHYLEMVFTGIYGLEILIKMFACGLIVKGGYFREPKNLIDFSLFCLNIAGFIFSSKLGILNALRAFHIVVLSKHFESLRIILISLIKSLPYLYKLLFFAFCFMLVFAVIPLRLLKGKMFSCVTLEDTYLKLVIDQIDCFDLGGDWVRNDFHYDNIFYSLFNLFVIASCEGWSHFSISAQDAIGVNIQPQEGYNRLWSIFFIIHFFIGNIMVFNAFTGVMTQKFNEINAKFLANQKVIPIKDKKFLSQCSSFKYTDKISDEDQEWLSIKRSIYNTQPIRTFEEPNRVKEKVRYYIYLFISSKPFEFFIDGCNISSAIIFSLYYHRAPEEYDDILDIINDSLVFVFTLEIILKLYVERCSFFLNRSNIFLTLIYISSIVPTIYRLKQDQNQVNFIFKLLEVFRVLRLIDTIPFIRSIISMMRFILPQIAPIAAVYLFTIYIYALFGMQLFAFIKPQKTLNGFDLHFKNFTSSVFTLIRVSTGEQWFFIVPDIVRTQQPNFVCYDIQDHEGYVEHGLNGCGSIWGYFYFFTFHLIVSVIILNLFIAVLLGLIKSQSTAVSKYQLSQIKDLWITYDRKGYGFIDYINFWQFTSRIAMIYGVKKDDLLDPNQKKNFLKFLSLPIYINRKAQNSIFGFRFHDVVVRMTQISLFLKYGILPGGKDESLTTLAQFYKELDEQTKFVGEVSQLKSGDIAVIILIQRRIKAWMRKGKDLNELKKNKPEEYTLALKNNQQNKIDQDLMANNNGGTVPIIAQKTENQIFDKSNINQDLPAEDTSLKQEDDGSNEGVKIESPKIIIKSDREVFSNNLLDMEQSENFEHKTVDENQKNKSIIRIFETSQVSHQIIQSKKKQ